MNKEAIIRYLNIHILTEGTVKIDREIIGTYKHIKPYLESLNVYSYDGLKEPEKSYWKSQIINHNSWLFYEASNHSILFAYTKDTTIIYNKTCFTNLIGIYSFKKEIVLKYMIKSYLNISHSDGVYEISRIV